jgi:hypothetical protein
MYDSGYKNTLGDVSTNNYCLSAINLDTGFDFASFLPSVPQDVSTVFGSPLFLSITAADITIGGLLNLLGTSAGNEGDSIQAGTDLVEMEGPCVSGNEGESTIITGLDTPLLGVPVSTNTEFFSLFGLDGPTGRKRETSLRFGCSPKEAIFGEDLPTVDMGVEDLDSGDWGRALGESFVDRARVD